MAPRIEQVRVLGSALPLTLVEIQASDGTIGVGGTEAPVSVIRPIIERPPWNLARGLRGREAGNVPQLAREMFVATLGQSGLLAYAQAALDIALWDLSAKVQRAALHRLLGPQVQQRIMPYASATAFDLTGGLLFPLRFKTTERLVQEARDRVSEGFRAIKFGWGNHFEPQDLERIAAIREAIGRDTRLMLDLGGPDYFEQDVSPAYVARISELLEPLDIYFFEEPLPPYDARGYRELKPAARRRIATGEMLCREWEFDPLLDPPAVDIIQPDAYRIGITPMLAVARRAADAGVLCVPHSPWSALALAAHVHILSTISTGVMVEYPSPSLYTDTVRHGELIKLANGDLFEFRLTPRDGFLDLPDRPGLGLGQFRPAAIQRMQELAQRGLER